MTRYYVVIDTEKQVVGVREHTSSDNIVENDLSCFQFIPKESLLHIGSINWVDTKKVLNDIVTSDYCRSVKSPKGGM